MTKKRLILQLLTLSMLAYSGLLFALIIPAWVRAQGPGVDLEKTPASQNVLSGANIVFTLRVTNTSGVNLTNLNISDPQCGPLNPPVNPNLNIGQSQTYTCSVQNVTVDFTNVATATANDGVGTVQDVDNATVNVIHPAIDVDKTPLTQTINSGGNASFIITVRNTGDVALNTLQIIDPQCDSLTGTGTTLNVAQVRTFTCTINSITDGIINVVTATAKPQNGPNVTFSDADGAEVILNSAVQACSIDPIAYLKLNESGGPTYDDFFSGHDGKCVGGNCPTALATGKVNGAQTFDGVNDQIIIPDVPGNGTFDWGTNDSFSIEVWMKGVPGQTCAGSGNPNNDVAVGRNDNTTSLQWWLGCRNTAGVAAFFLRSKNGNALYMESTTPITDGLWHHLVAVRDGVADRNHLYIDSVEAVSGTINYGAGFDSNIAELNVGWMNGSSNDFNFRGDLDEVALYSQALTPAQIATHYNNGGVGIGYCGGPPNITSTPVTIAQVDQLYTYDVNATGDPVPTYTLTISQTGMTIDSLTGLISWTPTASQTGSFPVQVQAINTQDVDTQDFTIQVFDGPIPLYLPIILSDDNYIYPSSLNKLLK
ncbi:MAG TPA: LamG-like jellyroll fold domain-containing protein [Anaerolineae bacterium]|nr:LamG-like jellyroll fold domain-containing protein [Anaerolineae bacterium]